MLGVFVIFQGGTDVPITVPGRLLAAAWWFFSMILISSYTGEQSDL